MSKNPSATDMLALVKDAKAFEAQLKKLETAEKAAQLAIDNSKNEVTRLKQEAGRVKTASDEEVARAKSRMDAAKLAEQHNVAVVKAAAEETQKANAQMKRLEKDADKIAQDREILKRDRAVLDADRAAFLDRVAAFNLSVQGIAKAAGL
jgi:thiamine kinase-like enzyme